MPTGTTVRAEFKVAALCLDRAQCSRLRQCFGGLDHGYHDSLVQLSISFQIMNPLLINPTKHLPTHFFTFFELFNRFFLFSTMAETRKPD